ncbi:unnamed protein product [Cylindrotheca closterium]|uniref:Ionotropic glutamate receptor C-terminal domain-containing protein n=1 Tax=Cylindrotheca closterium TaxID=2856 RepID=A0AAD2FY09_9STRA|nr:unnamed protein product [Cylindrotheca closterium]
MMVSQLYSRLSLRYTLYYYLVLSSSLFTPQKHHVAVAQPSSSAFGGELAFFQTPQMTPNVSHRQDVCDLYDAIRNGTTELKESLRGRQLNILVGAYEDSFFRYSRIEGIDPVYPGIAAVLLDELARRAGFTWRNSFGINMEAKGEAYNETWTDLLEWGIHAYDLSVDWWPRNLERLERGAAFTQEWYDSSIILIGKQAKTVSATTRKLSVTDYWNWLKPFSWEVWLTTLATILLSGLVFQILEWLNGNRGDRKLLAWWTENLFLSAINATQAYEYGTPKGSPSKIFCFSMALWSLILTATYTANLASLLVENQLPQVRVIQSLQEAVVFEYPICTWEGTNADTYVKELFPDAIRKPKKTLEEMYQGLHNGECAYAIEVIQQWLINQRVQKFNPYCDLEWVGNGKVVSASAAGFATSTDAGYKCTGLIRDVINIHMEEMIYDGFLRDAWEVENSLSQEVDCNTFKPEQFLSSNIGSNTGTTDSDTGDTTGERRRRLEVAKRRLEVAKKYNSRGLSVTHDGLSGTHRRLKASSKSAASSAGALEGSSDTSNQMELPAMLGTFFIHWAFMFVAVVAGVIKKYNRARKGKDVIVPTKEIIKEEQDSDQAGSNQTEKYHEETVRMKDELQWQMEDLLFTFQRSKATLVKEQEELQWKMDQLKGVLDEKNRRDSMTQDDLRSL